MNSWFVALLAVALVPRMGGAQDAAGEQIRSRRPNVLLVLSDDQGAGDVGIYGASDLRTPALDRLASRGVRFTHFYAAAPVCSPSRATLLTGLSPQAAGVPGNVAPEPGAGLPPERVTLAERFAAAGYRTAHVGKWHLGHDDEHDPLAQGFARSFGHLGGCIDNWSHFFYWSGPNRHDLWQDRQEIFRDGEYFPDLMLEQALAVVREPADAPFFLYFASNAPHYPYQGDAEWLSDYRERGVAHPRDLYGAFLSSLDERIGRLLDALEESGQAADTIVVFQSDHGHSTEVRAHGGGGSSGGLRGAKFSLFEGGIRVPAIVSWPGTLPQGEVRSQMASAADWVPTLLELCGLEPAAEPLCGRSLVALLRDPAQPTPHASLHWQRADRWAVRRGRWKLLHHPHDTSAAAEGAPLDPQDRRFLVDLVEDPGERTNLALRRPELVRELAELHQAWIDRGHRAAQ